MWSTNSPLLSSAIQILKLKSSAVNLKMQIPLVDAGCCLICLTFSPPPCRAHICPYCRRSRYAPESLSRLHKCYHNTDDPQIHSQVPLHLHRVCQCIPFSKPEQPCWFQSFRKHLLRLHACSLSSQSFCPSGIEVHLLKQEVCLIKMSLVIRLDQFFKCHLAR